MSVVADRPRLLNATQMAQEIGVKPTTLKSWARQKLVPCIKPTRRTLRFDPEQVFLALQAANRGGPTQ